MKTAGEGCLVFTAFDTKAPQLDKFDIKSPGTPVPPISAVELEAAVEAAKGLDLNDYKDDDAKTAFTAKLAEAEKLLADIYKYLIWLNHINLFNLFIIRKLSCYASISASNYKHTAHIWMNCHRHMNDHLVIYKLILLGKYNASIGADKSSKFL